MLTVVTHLWRQPDYHTEFRPEHVDALFRGVSRHYPRAFRFVCLADGWFQPAEFQDGVEVLHPGVRQEASVPNPSIRNGPSCYRRLRLFSETTQRLLGVPRGDPIVALDLDLVVVGDLRPLWDRPEPLVLWRDPLFHDVRYNGSMLLLRAGHHGEVWDRFDPERSPAETRRAGLLGSDQAWISHVVGDGVPTWGRDDGVYSYRLMTEPRLSRGTYSGPAPRRDLPENARVVAFHGRNNPWDPDVRAACPWVAEHYPAPVLPSPGWASPTTSPTSGRPPRRGSR